MTWWSWGVRRARASAALVLTILALVAVTTTIIAGTVGHSAAAATTAARDALGTAPADQAGVRVTTRLATDRAPAQDAAAHQIVGDAFGTTEVTVGRSVFSEAQTLGSGGTGSSTATPARVVALADRVLCGTGSTVESRAVLVDGTWPQAGAAGTPLEVALDAGAAGALHVGDQATLGQVPVQVVGLWRVRDAADPVWLADAGAASSTGATVTPAVVADETAVARVSTTPFVRWTVRPDTERLEPADLGPLATAVATLRAHVDRSAIDVRGVVVEGDLAATADGAARQLATARALGTIPLSILVLVSVIAVVQLARLLAGAREEELGLLLARGASPGQLVGLTLVESLLLTLLGTALGTAVALLVVRALPAGAPQARTVVTAGLLTGAAVLLALVVVVLLQVRRVAARRLVDRSGRTRSVAAIGILVLVVGGAALAWWQLRRTGSPLVTSAAGDQTTGTGTGVDLVAGAAPAMLLLTAGVLALALLGPLSRVTEAATRPGRGTALHLAATQVSRHLVVHAVPVVLTVLAVGATTMAGLYAGTSAQLRDGLREVAQGADVRVALAETPQATGAGASAEGPDLTGTPGVTATAVVRHDPRAQLGPLRVDAVVARPDALRAVALRPEDVPAASTPAAATGGNADDVAVTLTREAAAAAALRVGDTFTLTVLGSRVPSVLVAVTEAVPGTLAPEAALVDEGGLLRSFDQEGRDLPSSPPEVWLASDDLAATRQALAQDSRFSAVTTMAPVDATDAAGAARVVFWVAAAGSILLALTGIAAVAATLLQTRRPEVAVLRALGVTPGTQAGSRVLELAGVCLAAVALGVLAGLTVGRLVVPTLASSTTDPAQVRLAAPLAVEPALTLVLLLALTLGVALVLVALATRVRQQALAIGYREEIR